MLRIHNRRHEAAAAKSAWTIEGVVQVEESGERGSAPGARGYGALDPPTVMRCMNLAAST